jgi:hypothetical protein
MNSLRWIWCLAVVLFIGPVGGNVFGQFGGGGGGSAESKPDRATTAKAELKVAVERAEEMTGSNAAEETASGPAKDFCKCVGEADSGVVDKIEAALDGPLHSNGLDLTDTPLEEVVNLLQQDYGIPIQIDRPALDEIGMDVNEQITVNIHNISLRSALRLMLKQLQLTYIVGDEVLLIITPEEAESQFKVCVYDIRGLVEREQPKSLQALVDAIVSCVATETWAENGGGNGEIRPLSPKMLVISQTQGVHEEIAGFFETIRAMRQQPLSSQPPVEPQPAESE